MVRGIKKMLKLYEIVTLSCDAESYVLTSLAKEIDIFLNMTVTFVKE